MRNSRFQTKWLAGMGMPDGGWDLETNSACTVVDTGYVLHVVSSTI